jgi:hypothetical protein
LKDKKIKNKGSIVIGSLSGLITVLFLSELFQGLLALVFAKEVGFAFSGLNFFADFVIEEGKSILVYILLFASPLLLSILAVELSMIIMKRSPLGPARFSTIVFQLINLGYIIITLFYGAISILLRVNLLNDWVRMTNYLGIEGGERYPLVFFFLIILIMYLNLVTKRISGYINQSAA